MSLQDWGALGELVGGVAIIVSLIYVGLQIKHGNQETRAATLQATLDSEMFLQATATQYAGTWDKVVTGVHFADGEESRRAILLYNMAMTLYQNRYYQFKTGYLDYPPDFEEIVTWPIYEIWRTSGGASNRSTEFLKILDSQRERGIIQ
jgi:hypothetical protein